MVFMAAKNLEKMAKKELIAEIKRYRDYYKSGLFFDVKNCKQCKANLSNIKKFFKRGGGMSRKNNWHSGVEGPPYDQYHYVRCKLHPEQKDFVGICEKCFEEIESDNCRLKEKIQILDDEFKKQSNDMNQLVNTIIRGLEKIKKLEQWADYIFKQVSPYDEDLYRRKLKEFKEGENDRRKPAKY